MRTSTLLRRRYIWVFLAVASSFSGCSCEGCSDDRVRLQQHRRRLRLRRLLRLRRQRRYVCGRQRRQRRRVWRRR
ncbi:MAG: hypothetical protein DYH12_31980, partial [Sorangiineae bacterium PRO1]|nr:hypothetical protein [Sorangiineae bacterium PRO1]